MSRLSLRFFAWTAFFLSMTCLRASENVDQSLLQKLLNRKKYSEARAFLRLERALGKNSSAQDSIRSYLLEALTDAQLNDFEAAERNFRWAKRILENSSELRANPKLYAQALGDLELTEFDVRSLTPQ